RVNGYPYCGQHCFLYPVSPYETMRHRCRWIADGRIMHRLGSFVFTCPMLVIKMTHRIASRAKSSTHEGPRNAVRLYDRLIALYRAYGRATSGSADMTYAGIQAI